MMLLNTERFIQIEYYRFITNPNNKDVIEKSKNTGKSTKEMAMGPVWWKYMGVATDLTEKYLSGTDLSFKEKWAYYFAKAVIFGCIRDGIRGNSLLEKDIQRIKRKRKNAAEMAYE